jgi:hypothetical protein
MRNAPADKTDADLRKSLRLDFIVGLVIRLYGLKVENKSGKESASG